MSTKIQHNPILILPHEDVASVASKGRSAGGGAKIPAKFIAGSLSKSSAFLAEPFVLSQAEWAWLATQHRGLFQKYMLYPHDPVVLRELARIALGSDIKDFSQGRPAANLSPLDQYADLTAMSSKSLGIFFGHAGIVQPALVRVILDPASGAYRVEWRNTSFVSAKEVDRIFSAGLEHGSPTTRLTNHVALGKVVTDMGVSDSVIKGALVMLIPDETLFEPPSLIALSENSAGVPQYYRIGDEEAPKGSSVELVISPLAGQHVGERFRVGDLLDLLERDAIDAWKRGRTPALALDLDGTLFDARGYTGLLFREWLAQYDGPDAKAVRDIVAKAGNVGGWNGREILKGLGVTSQETLASAYAYHELYFFDPVRRASSLPIVGPINLVKILERRLAEKGVPLKKVFITLRNAKDDSLRNGTSSSEVSLRKNGIFDENSIIVRHDGTIDWSEEAYKNPQHEPEKWEMAAKYRRENPNVWFVAAFDNATAHINGYKKIFGHNIVSVHIKGDLPPNSPSLIDGVYTLDPWQLAREIEQLGGVPPVDLSSPPKPLSGPAFAPMLDAIKFARATGKRPVVAIDIDDTLLASSKRAKNILNDFLEEWVPGNSWVKDFVSKYIPSQVEFGGAHILSQAGLGHWGMGSTFNDYFMKHFLGPEDSHKVSVRQGALDAVLTLQSMGVRIIYLVARPDVADVRKGTADQLKALGFPVDDLGVELVMRKEPGESDEEFKRGAIASLVGPFDALVGAFDNEPGPLAQIGRRFSMAPLYLVGDRQSPDAPTPPEGVVPIANFLGKIGRIPPRGQLKLGEAMRMEGYSLGSDFIELMDRYRSLEGAGPEDNSAERTALMEKALASAASILARISALDAAHPTHAAFVHRISMAYDGVPESIERHIEGFVDIINRRAKAPFAILRGPEGVTHIVRSSNGNVEAKLYQNHAPYIRPSAIPVLKDSQGVNLASALSVIPSGPVLPGVSEADRYNALMFGGLTDTFPKMGFALSWAVGSLVASTGKDPSELLALEYSPGIALASMIALARMGVKVVWHESDEARRIQTAHAISHLPMEMQAKLKHVELSRKSKRVDMVLVNSTLSESFRSVAKKHIGGIIVSQSSSSAAEHKKKLPEDQKRKLLVEVELGQGEYVLPSSCMMHGAVEGQVAPVKSFEIWGAAR